MYWAMKLEWCWLTKNELNICETLTVLVRWNNKYTKYFIIIINVRMKKIITNKDHTSLKEKYKNNNNNF